MKNILILIIIISSVFSSLVKGQLTCSPKTEKVITEQTLQPPCVNLIARDYVDLKPGFHYTPPKNAEQPKKVELSWNFSNKPFGWYPKITLNSTDYTGPSLTSTSYGQFVFFITQLANNLPSEWNAVVSEDANQIVNVTISNPSNYSFSGNYDNFFTYADYIPANNGLFDAKVDDELLFNVSYLTDIPNLDTRVPDVNLPFGATAGSFNVTPSGAATYQIPIMVPKGLGGLEPQVSIAYNSQSGNGLLGWGCNLTGLSAITRVSKNLYSDNEVTGLTIDADDRFALDGNRLVLADAAKTYGGDGAAYRTENETFSHIVSNGTYGKNSPQSFNVYTKNGTVYKYGSNGGRVLYSASGKDAVLAWYLDYVEDVYGNTMSYTYEQNGLFTYLKSITYGTNKGGYGTISSVEFFYEQRSDPINIHYYPLNGLMDQVLNRVVSKTGDQVFRTYNFEYTQDINTHLSKVTESNGSGKTLNPTYFQWGNSNASTINVKDYTLPTDNYYSEVDFSNRNWTNGDVNGDGITDLICSFPYKDYYINTSNYKSYDNYKVVQVFTGNITSEGTTSFSIGRDYKFSPDVNMSFTGISGNNSTVHNLNGTSDIITVDYSNIEGSRQLNFYALNHSVDNPVLGQNLMQGESSTNSGNLWGVVIGVGIGTFTIDGMPTIAFGDLNNDGIDEIVYIESNKISDLYQGKIHYGNANPNWTNSLSDPWIPFNISLNNPPKYIFISDYNNDGLNDLMILNDDGYYIYMNVNGSINTISTASSTMFNSDYSVFKPGDFNGDGLIDFVLNEHDSNKWYFAINNGNGGFNKVALPLIQAYNQNFTDEDNNRDNCLVADFNNDGKSDLIIGDADYNYEHNWLTGDTWGDFQKFTTNWYSSTGDNVHLDKSAETTNSNFALSKFYVQGDFNGDGRVDLMNFGHDCYGTDQTLKWRMYSTPNTNHEGGMIKTISSGLTQPISIAYTTTAQSNYFVDASSPSYPLALLNSNVLTVKQVTTPNGVASKNIQTYNYTNGIVDLQRGFMGFGKFACTTAIENALANDPTTAISEQYYDFVKTSGTTNYYQPFLTTTKNRVGTTPVSEVSTPLASYAVTSLTNGSKHVFMYPGKKIQTDYLKNTVITSTTTMDTDGNMLTSETNTTDKDNTVIVASEKSTYNGYNARISTNPNPFKNAPDNIVIEQTHKDSNGKFSVTTSFTYKSNGSMDTKTDFSATTKSLVTSYTYDQVGNILTSTTGDRTTTFEYTTDKRFIKKQYNALNQFTEAAYDVWGNVISKWDINRLQTTLSYDDWGRLLSTTSADGRNVTSTINWVGQGNYSSYYSSIRTEPSLYYTSSVDEDGHFIGAEFFDAAGHTLQKSAGGFNGRVLNTDVVYNTKGEVVSVSDPYPSNGSPTKVTTNTYDNYGRLLTQTLPNLVTITTKQSDAIPRTTTTSYSNQPGKTYVKEYDAAGLLTKATDPGGSISYTYFSTGKPKSIQPSGGAGATSITYDDITGMQSTLTDPNSGTSTYLYNGYGELISQQDGNLKTTVMDYDKLGRIKTKTTGTIVTSYHYDPSGALGRVDYVTKTDGSGIVYKYDARTRVTEETRSKGSDAFTFKYEYDGKSRVSKETYPNNMALTYQYNTTSEDLMAIKKDNVAIWSIGTDITDVNIQGQIAKVTLGNGKVTSYGYDEQNRLTSISADNVINFTYHYNDKQQLEYRDERMFDGTAMKGFKESFTLYDDVNRLISATKDNGNTPLTMTYNSTQTDRIGVKSDVGTYNFPDANHKLDHINNAKTLFSPQNFTYNDEGRTTTITETNAGVVNKTLTLEYGVDGDRFKTEYTQDGNRKYTRYYDGEYEKEIMADGSTRHLNYIYAGGQLIAIFEQKSGGDKMHYVYTDYLGSLRCITNGDGSIIEQRLSYDAWGNRRNYYDGKNLTATELSDAIALTSRGFTGQEHVDGLGLINLNARFYNPVLGLFVSPDNYVQSPTNSQNFNRYSYCLNNPLLYADPSGNFFWLPIVAFAYASAISANMFYCAENNTNPFNPGNWNWRSPNTYIALALGAFQGFSLTMQHCEYVYDVNTGERIYVSEMGDGKYDVYQYGQWVDNHTGFELFRTEVYDVPFGGVDNIRLFANSVSSVNGIANLAYDVYNRWNDFSQKSEYFRNHSYPKDGGLEPSFIDAIVYAPIGLGRGLISASEVAAKSGGQSLIQLNRAAGNAFRDELAAGLQAEGRQVSTEVFKRTPFGPRYIDIEVSQGGRVLGGIETKVGSSPYTPLQRLKDIWLDFNTHGGYPVQLVRKP